MHPPKPGPIAREQDLEDLRGQAELIHRLTARIAANVGLDEILDDLVEQSIEVFGADRALVLLRGSSGDFEPRVARGLSPEFLGAVRSLPEASLARRAIRERRPLSAVQYANDPRGAGMREIVLREGFDSVAVAPLLDGETTIGLLILYHDQPRPYGQMDLDVLFALAGHASIAIRKAAALRRLEKWAAQLEAIQAVGSRLSGLSTIDDIATAIVTELGRVIESNNVRVYRVLGQVVEPIAWRGENGEYADETADELRVMLGEGITGWVALHGVAQYLPDANSDPRTESVPGSDLDFDESMLVAPMRHADRTTGVLVLSKLGVDQFEPDDLRLIEIFANLAAQAMASADETERRVRDSEARLRAIVDSANDAVLSVDSAGLIVGWNRAAAVTFGYGQEEIVGRPLTVLAPPPWDAHAPAALARYLAGSEASRHGATVEIPLVRRNGDEFPAEASLATWTVDGARYVTAMIRDITERRLAEAALRASDGRYRSLIESVPAVVYVSEFGPQGAWRYISPQIQTLLGYTPAEWTSNPDLWWGRIHPDDRDFVRQDEEDTWNIPEGERVGIEYRMLTREGQVKWIRDQATVIRTTDDGPLWQGFLTDVTDRKLLEEQLRHNAFHDPLTGLANRALFADRVQHALGRVARHAGSLAVLFIDLDDFKTINDGLGHGAGDTLLVEVGRRLLSTLRESDTAARLGGDEFAVLLEDLPDRSAAKAVAERLLAALGEPFRVEGREIEVSASIGIANPGSRRDSMSDLLRNADVAMYAAKRGGKGRYETYEDRMHAAALRRLELEGGIRRALDQGEFEIHYQPSVWLEDGAIAGFEALARWKHPEHGYVPPHEFIPLAEASGQIIPLGRWILEQACAQLRVWQDRWPSDPARTMSINVSARQLHDASFCDTVRAALDTVGVDPAAITLEITESVAMGDSAETLGRLRQLKRLGVRLAIDDFGTGYSSLNYLRRLPVDILKVDKAFVDGISDPGDGIELARVIVRIGKTLHLATVAEGVELAEQAKVLRRMGCEQAQGYLFARPMPAEQVSAILGAEGRPATLAG